MKVAIFGLSVLVICLLNYSAGVDNRRGTNHGLSPEIRELLNTFGEISKFVKNHNPDSINKGRETRYQAEQRKRDHRNLNQLLYNLLMIVEQLLALLHDGGGHSGSGYTGSYYTGGYNTGSYYTGSYYTGGYNTGSHYTGSYYTGGYNTGSHYTGSYYTGGYNSGSHYTGSYYTGGYNSGSHYTGSHYTSGDNTGFNNTSGQVEWSFLSGSGSRDASGYKKVARLPNPRRWNRKPKNAQLRIPRPWHSKPKNA